MSNSKAIRGIPLRLSDIKKACEAILQYTDGMSLRCFLEDRKTIDAVIRNIEILGEAANSIPRDFQEKHDLPWALIIGMRNRCIHGYFGIDEEIVWQCVCEHIPILENQIITIIKETEKND